MRFPDLPLPRRADQRLGKGVHCMASVLAQRS